MKPEAKQNQKPEASALNQVCSYTSDLGAGIRPQTPDTRSPSALSTETFGDSKLQIESLLCVSVVCVGALILSNSMSFLVEISLWYDVPDWYKLCCSTY